MNGSIDCKLIALELIRTICHYTVHKNISIDVLLIV